MKWLAKINLNIVFERLGPFKSALLLLSLICVSLFIGYRLGNYYSGFQNQKIAVQKQRLDKLYENQNEQVRRIHTLEVELAIEQLANQNALKTIKTVEQEHAQMKKKLAFYEKVMAPEKQADGLIIDAVTITPMESPQHFRFQVVLVQQERDRKFSKGNIELLFKGSKNNTPSTVSIEKVSKLEKKDLAFNFKFFQLIEGDFILADDFIPEQIVVNATIPKTSWQKAQSLEQVYSWQQALVSDFHNN